MENKIQKIYNIGLVPRRDKPEERAMLPFSQINWLLNGILFNRVSLITSFTDSGKSTIVSQIITYIIEQGYNCACYLGEDDAYESQERFFKQASKGEDSLEYIPYCVNNKQTNCGEFILSEEAWQKAHNKFNDKLFLYNTRASTTVDSILAGFDEARTKYNCKVFVIDNVDQFEFATDNENKELKDDTIKIRNYAVNNKVHIFLIAHIRKTERDVLLPTIYDVKGTSSLTNICKNILIVVRTDKMDKTSKAYKQLRKLIELNNYNLDEADCLVHVAKTKGRSLGFACLKYNKKFNTYYDCKKIDENKKEDDNKPVLYVEEEPNVDMGLIPLTKEEQSKLPF